MSDDLAKAVVGLSKSVSAFGVAADEFSGLVGRISAQMAQEDARDRKLFSAVFALGFVSVGISAIVIADAWSRLQ